MSPNPALQGLSDDAVICGSCHQIRGTALAGFHQRCACEPLPDPEEPRYGHDFLMAAELCRCCGLVLLRSGSKWSVWFCVPCKDLARSFNEQVGRCVIPIGRHSLMNGVGLKGTDAKRNAAVKRFAEELGSLFARVGWMDDWKGLAVRHNLVVLGAHPDHDLPLADYLDLVALAPNPALTSESAFARMVDALDR